MKRTGRKRTCAAAFLLCAGILTGICEGAMVSHGAVYVSDEIYDWEGNADRSTGRESSKYGDSNVSPGAVFDDADEQEMASGPTVTQVSLTERYHEDYKTYEESVNGLFFFYSNVSNGGITDENVILDIPQNMFCSVEKDGAEYDYVPGQAFTERGTYVIRVTAVEDTSVPFSQQREYRALFRFRIQEKPPEESEEETKSQSAPAGLGSNGSGMLLPQSDSVTGKEESQEESNLEEAKSQEPSQEEPDAQEISGEENPDEESGGEGNDDEDLENDHDIGREFGEEAADGEEAVPGSYRQRTQIYDKARGRYEVTFENGRTLLSNVPEGYIGPGAVELLMSEGGASLYRDDESLEYTEDMSIKEPGYYRLDVDGQTWSFAIASAVGSMEYYVVPGGMKFTDIYYEGEPKDVPDGRYLSMKEDGQYEIVMTGEEGEALDVILKKDTKAPQFSVSLKGGKAQIQYESDDIADIILEKDGEIQEGFSGYTIESPGSYRLVARDEAGNASSAEFTLKYQVNKYGIAAIMLMILLIAGGAVFVIRMKKTVSVR